MNRYLKTLCEMEKLSVKGNLSFSYHVFFLLGEHSAIFIKFEIVAFKLFNFVQFKNCRLGKDQRDILTAAREGKIKLESV